MSDGAKPLGLRDEAIAAAEALVRSKQPEIPDAYEGAINSPEELDAFYQTALDVVLSRMIAADDPQADKLRAELAKVVEHTKELSNSLFNSIGFERAANIYWTKLLNTAEKERRTQLSHGADLFKNLAISQDVHLLRYYPEHSSNPFSDFVTHKYDVEVGGIGYTISFHGDDVEIEPESIDRWTSVYKADSAWELTECSTHWRVSGHRKTSLADIMDMSAFRLYRVQDRTALENAMTPLLREAPVRSTDPNLQKLIELASEIKKLDFARMPYDSLVERARDIVRRAVRIYFSLKSMGNEYAEKLTYDLNRFIYQNPHLAAGALEDVENLEELTLFRMRVCVQHKEVEKKMEELVRRVAAERFEKIKGFDRLSAGHREELGKILKVNKLPEKYWERFVADFGRVPEKHAKHYANLFIQQYQDDDDNRFESFMYYARALEGLKEDKYFEAFVYYFNHKFLGIGKPTTELITASRLIRNLSFREYESKAVGLILSSVGYNARELEKGLRRFRRIVRKVPADKATVFTAARHPTLPQTLFSIFKIIENLYGVYGDDVDVFVRKLWNWEADKLNFAKLNRLTEPQRARLLRYMNSNGSDYPAPLLNFLADMAVKVKTEDEWNFVTTFRLKEAGDIPSEELMSGNANIAARYPNVWPALENLRAQSAGIAVTDDNLRLLGSFIQRGTSEDKIVELVKYLPRIILDIQRRTIEILSTDENVVEIFAAVAGSMETFTKIGDSEPYLKALSGNPRPEEIPLLAQVFSEAERSYLNLETPILRRVGNLPRFLIETHAKFKEFDVSSSLEKIVKREETAGANPSQTAHLMRFYVDMKVTSDDLKDQESVEKMIADFEAFLLRTKRAGYNINADPDQERARAMLEPEKVLAKSDEGYVHLAFIINVLMDSSPEYSREKLTSWALAHLDNENLIIRTKAAKLLIGLGTPVRALSPDVIRKIAGLAVNERVFGRDVSNVLTADIIAIARRENAPELPLSLFFSMVLNCGLDVQTELEKKIERYAKMENEPVYEGRLIVLAHDTRDLSHSFLNGSDTFSPEAHIGFARLQNLNVAVYRYGRDGENVESMMSALETAEGDVTVAIGGHGVEGKISFGGESFSIDEFFERLARRLARQKEGKPWKTKLIFFSCYSDKNIELLLKKWANDERTRGKPTTMLSSSGNNSPSLKIASDAWITKANHCKETGRKLTWKEFYRDIESRSFIMYDPWSRFNSNMTLYVDGEKVD